MTKESPTACVLVIGNEILTGRTADANLPFLGARFMAMGIQLREARILPDTRDAIIRTVRDVSQNFDYVITTGGIGPTHDDITAECVAAAFGVSLHEDPDARRRLENYYGAANVTPARLRMARVPQGARLIDNPVSGAPGFQMGNVFVLAGVPKIMQAMFDGLGDRLKGGRPIKSRAITCQIPESILAEGLRAIAEKYTDLDFGSYPYFRPQALEAGGRVGEGRATLAALGVSLVIRGLAEERMTEAAAELRALIESLGGTPTDGEA